MNRVMWLMAGGLCLAVLGTCAQAQSVRVVQAPELAADPVPRADDAMVVYIDPETGEFTATPPEGVRAAQFPELAFDPSMVLEEVLADGTTVTWLNGQGMEAMWLTTDAQGRAQTRCSSDLLGGRHGDLRGGLRGADNER